MGTLSGGQGGTPGAALSLGRGGSCGGPGDSWMLRVPAGEHRPWQWASPPFIHRGPFGQQLAPCSLRRTSQSSTHTGCRGEQLPQDALQGVTEGFPFAPEAQPSQ